MHEPAHRTEHIARFQELVWKAEDDPEAVAIWTLLRDLAYDLDFCEANPEVRAEDPSYYGEERLLEQVAHVLEKLGNT